MNDLIWNVCFLHLFCFIGWIFKQWRDAFLPKYLQSVCTVAVEGTDRILDKYVLSLHCSLSCVCVCMCACCWAYVCSL